MARGQGKRCWLADSQYLPTRWIDADPVESDLGLYAFITVRGVATFQRVLDFVAVESLVFMSTTSEGGSIQLSSKLRKTSKESRNTEDREWVVIG